MENRPKIFEEFCQAISDCLKSDYNSTKKIDKKKNFLKGRDREFFIREAISGCIPTKIVVSNSVIFDYNDNESKECDIVIYDESMPILDYGSTKYLCSTGVYAHIEVKSYLNSEELNNALDVTESVKKMGRQTIFGEKPKIFSCVFSYDGVKIDSFKKNFEKYYLEKNYKDEHVNYKIDAICVLNKYTAIKERSKLASPEKEIFFLESGNSSLMIFLTKLLTGMYGDMDSDLNRFAGLDSFRQFHDIYKRK